MSRRLRSMGSSVVRLKYGRTPLYALTTSAFGVSDTIPLYAVNAHGNAEVIANLRPLAHGGYLLELQTGAPTVLLGRSGTGVYDDLPYFLQDMAPQGFLGRQLAKALYAQSPDFPTDPRNWNASQLGRYLVSNGDDLPGNLKLGEQAHLRLRRAPSACADEDYPGLADSVLSGTLPGSSAGGEQPKFTAFHGERQAHVIVKFSPRGSDPVARRWQDILVTEFHAAETLHAFERPAAETRLVEQDERLFLESLRFDRRGQYGRMSMLSLQAIDAEFVGSGSDWIRVVDALHRQDLVSDEDVFRAALLWHFGRLINNTDMHLGNLSFRIEDGVFRMLPAYDMCCMGFAPKMGHVEPLGFDLPNTHPKSASTKISRIAREMAHDFWNRVRRDDRISEEFASFIEHSRTILAFSAYGQ